MAKRKGVGKEALAAARRAINRESDRRRDMIADDMAIRLRKREGPMKRVQVGQGGQKGSR